MAETKDQAPSGVADPTDKEVKAAEKANAASEADRLATLNAAEQANAERRLTVDKE